MTYSYLLSDAISRIKNAQLVRRSNVCVITSNLVNKFLKILLEEGYIANFNIYKKYFNLINVYLKYDDINSFPVINEIKIISKPGKRMYCSYKNIPNSYNGLGLVILSTSKGVMTSHKAKKNKCGGEVLCQVF
jgi:small subunit ribosomal protein S8